MKENTGKWWILFHQTSGLRRRQQSKKKTSFLPFSSIQSSNTNSVWWNESKMIIIIIIIKHILSQQQQQESRFLFLQYPERKNDIFIYLIFVCLFVWVWVTIGIINEKSLSSHCINKQNTEICSQESKYNLNIDKQNKFNWTTKTNKTKQRGKNKILFVCLVRLSIYAVCRIIMEEDKFWIIILILIIIISYFIIYVCCFRKPKKSNGTGLFAWFDSNSGT